MDDSPPPSAMPRYSTHPDYSYPPLDMLARQIRLRDEPELPLGLPEVKRYDWAIRKMTE